MTKKKAFLIHLSFSLLIFLILLLMIIYVWYPAPYFDSAYRMKWIKIIAFVDVILGPGLTLLVFKQGKPSLKMDMTFILLIQMAALSWGVFNAWSVHPKMNVFFDNQVYCFDQKEMKQGGVAEQFGSSPMADSINAILPYPETVEEKLQYLKDSSGDIQMVYRLGHLFQKATTEMTSKLGEKQPDIMEVIKNNSKNEEVWKEFISDGKAINKDWRYFPYNCFDANRMMVLNRQQNKVEAILDIKLPINWAFN